MVNSIYRGTSSGKSVGSSSVSSSSGASRASGNFSKNASVESYELGTSSGYSKGSRTIGKSLSGSTSSGISSINTGSGVSRSSSSSGGYAKYDRNVGTSSGNSYSGSGIGSSVNKSQTNVSSNQTVLNDPIFSFENGNYITTDQNGKSYYVDVNEKQIYSVPDDSQYSVKNLYARYAEQNSTTTEQNVLNDPIFSFENGNYITTDQNGKSYYVDVNGKQIYSIPDDSQYSVKNLYARYAASVQTPSDSSQVTPVSGPPSQGNVDASASMAPSVNQTYAENLQASSNDPKVNSSTTVGENVVTMPSVGSPAPAQTINENPVAMSASEVDTQSRPVAMSASEVDYQTRPANYPSMEQLNNYRRNLAQQAVMNARKSGDVLASSFEEYQKSVNNS